MNAYIVGLGAIGTLFASQFIDKGYHIKILVDNDRFDRYSNQDFIINGKGYSFTFVKLQDVTEHIDMIFICSKHHHLQEIIPMIKDIIDHDTLIISLINGIDSEYVMKEGLSAGKIIHAYVVGTDATKIGSRTSFVLKGNIIFGNVFNEDESDLYKIEAFLKYYQIGYKRSDNILKDLWWKLMVNVGLNQVTAIYQSNYGELNASEEQRKLVDKAMEEVIRVAQKEGINLTYKDKEDVIRLMKSFDSNGQTSMLQDVLAKRKTEVEIFAKKIILLGKKYHIDTPVNQFLYDKIIEIEKGYL